MIDNLKLERYRSFPADVILVAVADHAKLDPTFKPIKNSESARWHASIAGKEFEFVLTGSKFWDTRAEIGGAGAVDLVMHLMGLSFRKAVRVVDKVLTKT